MAETLVEKEVRITLTTRILPFIIASERPAPQYMRWGGGFHFYATEIVSVIIGWGVFSSPVFKLIAGQDGDISWGAASGVSIALSVLWTGFVLWLKRASVTEKLIRHEGCQAAFRELKKEVHATLASEASPQKALIELAGRVKVAAAQHKEGFLTVDETSQAIRDDARSLAIQLVSDYRDGWTGEVPLGPGAMHAAPQPSVGNVGQGATT